MPLSAFADRPYFAASSALPEAPEAKPAEEAGKAVARMDKTFIDTSRIGVELARGVGDATLPRPWSKYSEGSSRFQGKPGGGGAAETNKTE